MWGSNILSQTNQANISQSYSSSYSDCSSLFLALVDGGICFPSPTSKSALRYLCCRAEENNSMTGGAFKSMELFQSEKPTCILNSLDFLLFIMHQQLMIYVSVKGRSNFFPFVVGFCLKSSRVLHGDRAFMCAGIIFVSLSMLFDFFTHWISTWSFYSQFCNTETCWLSLTYGCSCNDKLIGQ